MTSVCRYLIIYLAINLATIHQVVYSQTVWIDVDSGKIVGVSPSKSAQNQQQHQYPQQNRYPYPNNNNNNNNGNNNNYGRNSVNPGLGYNQRNEKNINPQWVCRNSVTGDTMIIASEIMTNRFPEQLQPDYNQPQQQHYQDNPWLNGQNNQQQQNNNQAQTTDRPYQETTTLPPTQPTLPPIIQTTKKPFPSLDNIDWGKYVETTTMKSKKSPSNLNQAIDGEGIIMPRGGNF